MRKTSAFLCIAAALATSCGRPSTGEETDASDAPAMAAGSGAPVPAAVETVAVGTENADAAEAHRAIWLLVATPGFAVPFLNEQLQPVKPVSAEQIARMIDALDDDQFRMREKATWELEKLGDLASPGLQKFLAGRPSVEAPPTRRPRGRGRRRTGPRIPASCS